MSKLLPKEYIVSKFYEYAGYPKYIRGSGDYRGCCPTCREGKSWGKKRRLNYVPDKGFIHCFNCNKSWSPVNWIIDQSGLEFSEVLSQAEEYGFDLSDLQDKKFSRPKSETLPEDSINLFDEQQVNYFSKNKVVMDALKFMNDRRLNTAINKPKAFYISIKDFIHKNRLVIPFYNYNGKILWYQTRAIYKKDEVDRPKYMSKLNSDRSIFGLDRINEQQDHIFIFEGPIDSMFVKNGIAMAGISLSDTQEKQLERYTLYNKIWVLDNQIKENEDVKNQAIKLIESGETIFIWPEKYKGIKDVNELCVKVGKDSIRPEFFIKNSYEGSMGLAKIAELMKH